MAKIQLKSDNINPFGGLFSILNQFDRSGLRQVIDEHLGRRGQQGYGSAERTEPDGSPGPRRLAISVLRLRRRT